MQKIIVPFNIAIFHSLFTIFHSVETTLLLKLRSNFFANVKLLEGTPSVFQSPPLDLRVRSPPTPLCPAWNQPLHLLSRLQPDILCRYLVDVVEVWPFVWPIVVALFDSVFHEGCQHDNNDTAVLPDHLQTKKDTVATLWLPNYCVTCIITALRHTIKIYSIHRKFISFSLDTFTLQLLSNPWINWHHILQASMKY